MKRMKFARPLNGNEDNYVYWDDILSTPLPENEEYEIPSLDQKTHIELRCQNILSEFNRSVVFPQEYIMELIKGIWPLQVNADKEYECDSVLQLLCAISHDQKYYNQILLKIGSGERVIKNEEMKNYAKLITTGNLEYNDLVDITILLTKIPNNDGTVVLDYVQDNFLIQPTHHILENVFVFLFHVYEFLKK